MNCENMCYQILSKSSVSFIVIFLAFTFASCDSSQNAQTSQITNSATTNVKTTANNLPPNPKRKKIVAFGDSLTAGFGLTEAESYTVLLQQKLQAEGYDYEVVNAGISGDTSSGGLDRIDWSLKQPNVEVLILELGANDMLKGLSVAEMKSNLRKMIQKAKAKNVKVLFCGMLAPVSMGEYQREFSAAFTDLAKEEKVAFLPFFLDKVGGIKTLNQADGIHPNAEGEKIIAETVFQAVKSLLKK